MIDRDIKLRALASRRMRVAGSLSVLMVVVYFGFILAIAFNKPLMGRLLGRGLSVGIVAGAVVIVVSWLLTWIYVRWANDTYDRALAELQS